MQISISTVKSFRYNEFRFVCSFLYRNLLRGIAASFDLEANTFRSLHCLLGFNTSIRRCSFKFQEDYDIFSLKWLARWDHVFNNQVNETKSLPLVLDYVISKSFPWVLWISFDMYSQNCKSVIFLLSTWLFCFLHNDSSMRRDKVLCD